MARLVVVVPLKEGAYEDARALLRHGAPFDLERTQLDRHEVYVTEREAVFVLAAEGPTARPRLPGEDLSPCKAAAAWQKLTAGRPRTADVVYAWTRFTDGEAVFFDPTPGPGDSEGGEVFPP